MGISRNLTASWLVIKATSLAFVSMFIGLREIPGGGDGGDVARSYFLRSVDSLNF